MIILAFALSANREAALTRKLINNRVYMMQIEKEVGYLQKRVSDIELKQYSEEISPTHHRTDPDSVYNLCYIKKMLAEYVPELQNITATFNDNTVDIEGSLKTEKKFEFIISKRTLNIESQLRNIRELIQKERLNNTESKGNF